MEQWIVELLIGLVQKYPWAAVIMGVMSSFRLVFKPTFGFLRTFVQATPWQKDDLMLDGFMNSKIYKGLAWVADYLLSIKLPGYDVK